MPPRTLASLDALKELVGQEVAVTDWFTMTQERIQQFADATLDHQWIHVDVDRAKRESPFKAPIAHGFLTLSLLAHFMESAVSIDQKFSGGKLRDEQDAFCFAGKSGCEDSGSLCAGRHKRG